MSDDRQWDVLLIGGASGVGKTSVSYRVARHFGIGITEVDDFHLILELMTTPEQYPVIHLFRTDPEAFFRMSEDEKLEHAIAYSTVMARPLEHVIANHLDFGPPLVLEGDFILPKLAARPSFNSIAAGGRVRVVIIHEDEQQIATNFHAREGEPQPGRAHTTWRYSEWLRQEAARLGLPAVPARPWETVLERVLDALR